jgi:protein TonB
MKSYLILLFLSLSSLKVIAQVDTSEIFTVVENMPAFPGCEDLPTNVERKKCTEINLLKLIYKNMNLNINSLNDTCIFSSLVVISFIIDTTGYVTEIKELHGCEDLAKEAIRVIESMNEMPQRWKAGEQRGQKVRVKYNLPLRLRFRPN